MKTDQVDSFAEKLSSMDRKSLVSLLRHLKCRFDLDFTDDFLSKMSLRRLRHIALGAMIHAKNARSALRKRTS